MNRYESSRFLVDPRSIYSRPTYERPDKRGKRGGPKYYFKLQRGGSKPQLKTQLISPTVQAVEQAKSDIRRKKKINDTAIGSIKGENTRSKSIQPPNPPGVKKAPKRKNTPKKGSTKKKVSKKKKDIFED
jgi:hypothetical protein